MNKFRNTVYDVVKKIPIGSTLSYKEVAIKSGNPKASRAVANLMASNYDTTIPCHRVIKSNGTLGGYNRGGEDKKRSLLKSENAL